MTRSAGWAAWLALLPLWGCAGSYRLEAPPPATERAPRQVLQLRWQRQLTQRQFLEYKPQEWASAAIDPSGVVYIGSSAKRFEAIRAVDGAVIWTVRTLGAVASSPLLDLKSGTVYFGCDDGRMYAVDTKSGRVKWSYTTQGTINRQPVYAEGVLLFTSSESRIYALDAASGKWRWQYDREVPEGFTIHGYAGVAVKGDLAYTGFPDGMLVALRVRSGDVVWTRSLAGGKTQFVDVDATPIVSGDVVYTASFSGGLYALAPDNGSVKWHYPAEGLSEIILHRGTLFATAPRLGLLALDLSGRLRWRQAVADGVPSRPFALGSYLFLTGTETGLYVASVRDGKLLEYFNPGLGISASPSAAGGVLVVLSNAGKLYAFQIVRGRAGVPAEGA